MYWVDYFEVVEFDKERKDYIVKASYGVGDVSQDYEGRVERASDAQRKFLEFRTAFKRVVKGGPDEAAE